MNELVVSAFGCLVLGIMASLHPCPMTTNIAAISMIVGFPGRKRRLLKVIVFFGLGYMISLVSVALIVNISIISIPVVNLVLQNAISLFLGPVLILSGMIIAGLLKFNNFYASPIKSNSIKNKSYVYIFSGGLLLALAFCPATASLYFGVMIPLSIKFNQAYLFPIIYSIGGFLPIVAIGFLIKKGGEIIMNRKWTKLLTSISGYLLIIIGIYISIQRLYLN